MCSAWTHIAADTLRSIAVLVAASISALFPYVLSPIDADSLGAVLVSIVILVSLGPLIQGIYNTALGIRRLLRQQKI
jgi:Co/Zn/Cd efflux system component